MSNNAFLDEIEHRYSIHELGAGTLATLAVAQELLNANRLTAAANAPRRAVLGTQEPISPGTMSRTMTIPYDSGDARLAEAARTAARRHETRSAHPKEILAELLRAVDEEDQR